MKKILVILVVAAAGLAAQSCGGGEKCPTYTQTSTSTQTHLG